MDIAYKLDTMIKVDENLCINCGAASGPARAA